MLRLHLPKTSFQARGTSPDGCWGVSATHNRKCTNPRAKHRIFSSGVLCDFVPGPFEFFYMLSSQDFPLCGPASPTLGFPSQPRNPGLFNAFPPHSNDTHKVIDTQCTFV